MIIYAGMTKNVNFVKEVSSHFRSDAEIIVVSVQSLLDFHLLCLHSVCYIDVFKNSGSDVDIVVSQGCQLGKRSMMAATDLLTAVSSFFNILTQYFANGNPHC